MNCGICDQNIEAAARKFEAPCCERVFHSQCIMNSVRRFLDMAEGFNPTLGPMRCGCGFIHWAPLAAASTDNGAAELAVKVAENREMSANIKAVKSKFRKASSSLRLLKHAIVNEYEHFMNGAQLHINALRNIQKASYDRVRHGVEYMNASKAFRSARISLLFLKRKYNLGLADTRILFPSVIRQGFIYFQPVRLLVGKFCINLAKF
jgi:hypothetical protein